MIEAGDRLHLLVRQEVAVEFGKLLGRWRDGPIGAPPRRRPAIPRPPPVFASRPWRVRGRTTRSARSEITGVDVVEQIRTRRDRPGALVAARGRPLRVHRERRRRRLGAAGPGWRPAARCGMAKADAERAWWREVIGALATY